jgi:hypothetical protein
VDPKEYKIFMHKNKKQPEDYEDLCYLKAAEFLRFLPRAKSSIRQSLKVKEVKKVWILK